MRAGEYTASWIHPSFHPVVVVGITLTFLFEYFQSESDEKIP